MEGFVVMAVVFAAIFAVGYVIRQNQNQKWAAIAASIGLDFVEGSFLSYPRLLGSFDGVDVVVDTETRGSGKSKTVYTRFSATIPEPMPAGLALLKEGFLSGIGKFFGAQDIQLGDKRVDDALIIKGEDVAGVKRLLADRAVADAAIEVVNSGSEGSIQGQTVKILLHSINTNEATHRLNLELVSRAARVLAGGSPRRAIAAPSEASFFDHVGEAEPAPVPVPVAATPPIPEAAPARPSPPAPRAGDVFRPDGNDPRLARISDPMTGYGERSRLLEELGQSPLWMSVVVDKVERTKGLSLAPELREGRTLVARAGQLEVALRFPAARNEEIDALAQGATLKVQATVADYDNFYRRLVADVG
jgi:hypothetical protein